MAMFDLFNIDAEDELTSLTQRFVIGLHKFLDSHFVAHFVYFTFAAIEGHGAYSAAAAVLAVLLIKDQLSGVEELV